MSLPSQLVNNWATNSFQTSCSPADMQKNFFFATYMFKKKKVVLLSLYIKQVISLVWSEFWTQTYMSMWLCSYKTVFCQKKLEFASPVCCMLHVVGQDASESIRDVSVTSIHVADFKTSSKKFHPLTHCTGGVYSTKKFIQQLW